MLPACRLGSSWLTGTVVLRIRIFQTARWCSVGSTRMCGHGRHSAAAAGCVGVTGVVGPQESLCLKDGFKVLAGLLDVFG